MIDVQQIIKDRLRQLKEETKQSWKEIYEQIEKDFGLGMTFESFRKWVNSERKISYFELNKIVHWIRNQYGADEGQDYSRFLIVLKQPEFEVQQTTLELEGFVSIPAAIAIYILENRAVFYEVKASIEEREEGNLEVSIGGYRGDTLLFLDSQEYEEANIVELLQASFSTLQDLALKDASSFGFSIAYEQ